jgi:hypothetical protein
MGQLPLSGGFTLEVRYGDRYSCKDSLINVDVNTLGVGRRSPSTAKEKDKEKADMLNCAVFLVKHINKQSFFPYSGE